MVKTRYQILADPLSGQRAYSSYLDLIRTIWKEEGPPGFFKGLSASYIGCFEGAIQWIVYEKARSLPMLPTFSTSRGSAEDKGIPGTAVGKQQGRVLNSFLAAGLAKFVAVVATYPHEVVRTRLREQALNGAFKYKGFFPALSTIAREDGIR